MKSVAKYCLLLLMTGLIAGCANGVNTGSSDVDLSASNSVSSESSSSASSSTFNPTAGKEDGLALEAFNEEVNKLGTSRVRKIRYTYHIVEKIVGEYTINGLTEAGEYTADLVVEPKNGNSNDMNLVLISGTATTQMQKFYAKDYCPSITASGWLQYHAQRRVFKNQAQEGEGFEERFYVNPMKTWMISWGNRPANITSKEGDFFAYEEFDRTYDAEGYVTSFMIKEYESMHGTITSHNNGTMHYDGYYEIVCNCTVSYLD